MIKKIILLNTLIFSLNASAISFKDVVKSLSSHESVELVRSKGLSTKEEAGTRGSWGDPKLKIAAKNFPKDSLQNDQTPMTGFELGLSQKMALTTKYGNIKNAFTSLSNALNFKAENKKELLTKSLWETVIIRKKVVEEVKILNENFNWITKILKVSKKLYANGKTSQQAILDLQIRRSELESSLSNKKYEISQIEDNLFYLIRTKVDKLDYSTVPWGILNSKSGLTKDYKGLAFKERLTAKEYALTASKLNYIPDLTLAIGYTKRANIDGNGDFVGASISFPLSFSDQRYSNHRKALYEKYGVIKEYENYKRSKSRDSSILSKEIEKLQAEISILMQKTIKFAANSRTITAKSYALGNSTYVELLQSELKLQKILLKKVMLEALRDIKKITLKYILGEPL